jgi:hypothetical protein
MAACAECGKEFAENEGIVVGPRVFCGNVCRFTWERKNSSSPAAQQLPLTAGGGKAPVKTRIVGVAVAAGLLVAAAVVIFQSTTRIFTGGGRGLREFYSAEGKFSVRTGFPVEKTEKSITAGTAEITVRFFSARSGKTDLVVAFCDYPGSIADSVAPAEILDGARDGEVREVKGELLSETPVSHQGRSGRDLQIETPDGKVIRSRILLSDRRMYQLMAITKGGRIFSGKMQRFFDSFAIKGNEGQ